MNNFVINLINDYSYLGIFLGMILEAIIIIIPSELILATGGILVSSGVLNFFLTFLTGLLGSTFCAVIIYFMGYIGGNPFIEKYGKYFFMKKEDIEKCNIFFNKYGLIASCIGRNLPIIRTLISIPIGISKISFTKFFLYTLIGSIPWTLIFVYFGYALGNNWTILQTYTSKLKIPILILLSILIVSYIIKKIKNK